MCLLSPAVECLCAKKAQSGQNSQAYQQEEATAKSEVSEAAHTFQVSAAADFSVSGRAAGPDLPASLAEAGQSV